MNLYLQCSMSTSYNTLTGLKCSLKMCTIPTKENETRFKLRERTYKFMTDYCYHLNKL